ncbi:hypothetical protein TNCV_602141 [Trichonephila clavipes]|nr:hypothetical protein TNCV_602141 [Trichonephila clavipes]
MTGDETLVAHINAETKRRSMWLFAEDEELKNAVAHWFKSQVAAFYAKEIDKLVKQHEKCLKNEADYAEK